MQNWGDQDDQDLGRRLAVRRPIKTRLRVRIWQSSKPEYRAQSLNLSERGVFFTTTAPFTRGDLIEVLLKMPKEITGQPPTEWRCTGMVVRIERGARPERKIGVGVAFHRCEVLGSGSPPQSPHRAVCQRAGAESRSTQLIKQNAVTKSRDD